MGRFSIRKLFLDSLVIVCLIVAGWVGYQLFVLHNLDPVMGSIIFIVDVGVLIWNVTVLRNHYYRRMYPSFKIVFLLLFAVVLILAFAGIEPLASYKDLAIEQVTSIIDGFKGDTFTDGDVNIVYTDQDDVEYEIIGFNRLWLTATNEQLDDHIELVVLCKPTERTWEKAYILEVIGEYTILNTLDPTNSMNWKWFHALIPETITLRVKGTIIKEMLLDAEQRYEEAKVEAEEIVEKQEYNFFMRGEVPSYEEYKRQEEKLEELNNEMKKWDAYSNGGPYEDEGYNLHNFCSKYITVAITRYDVVGE